MRQQKNRLALEQSLKLQDLLCSETFIPGSWPREGRASAALLRGRDGEGGGTKAEPEAASLFSSFERALNSPEKHTAVPGQHCHCCSLIPCTLIKCKP